MKMIYHLPTKIIMQKNAVKESGTFFSECGKKAFIITGKSSAQKSGALKDVLETLEMQEIPYVIFDEIENNPSVETVERAMHLGRMEEVDFCIGIGGGSPLDASKALAVLIANPDMKVLDLFQNTFTKACPIIAIPTTAGTGSEATPYSVLLRKDLQTKVSFGNKNTFPTLALIDSKYTESLGRGATINTAIDAFTHLLEGYLANRSMPVSDAWALSGIDTWGSVLPYLKKFDLTSEAREKLMYASLLGGMVIAHTGVTIAHGMGYCFTYFHDIPHGKANGLLMSGFNVILMKNYFSQNIPVELLEAAKVDGANEFRIFFRIVLPMSQPVLATVGLFVGIGYWNNWTNGLYYVNKPELYSLQNYLNRIIQDIQFLMSNSEIVSGSEMTASFPSVSIRMAIAVVGILPIMVLYPYFQKYFIKGISVGAIKG